MNTESLASTAIGRPFVRLVAAAMESRLRYRFFGPIKILQGVDYLKGKSVLEVGCGTGFFTIPAARLIGDHGSLTAMDILQESIDLVNHKVQSAGLKNVRLMKGDVLDTKLDSGRFDIVILFGVLPAPMLPLKQVLTELKRVLKPDGTLAVWPPIPGWLPRSILKFGVFTQVDKRNGVYNFK